MACNNIRPRTMAFYTFLGYTAERLPHYYRLADKASYAPWPAWPAGISFPREAAPCCTFCRTRTRCGNAAIRPTPPAGLIKTSGIWRGGISTTRASGTMCGPLRSGAVQALLATRCIPVNGTCVLRIVDYTGVPEAFSRLGAAVSPADGGLRRGIRRLLLLGHSRADDGPKRASAPGTEDDLNIIPNYLTPPLCENTEYYFFTSEPAAFTMFKADGDQDRPNIRVE